MTVSPQEISSLTGWATPMFTILALHCLPLWTYSLVVLTKIKDQVSARLFAALAGKTEYSDRL